jgi:MBG domain (YGX type)/Cadherin domain
MKYFIKIGLILAVIANLFVSTSVALADTTTVVTVHSADWLFINDNGTAGDWTQGFEHGPATPPLGDGSFSMQLNSSSAGIIFGTQKYQGTLLSNITSLGYSTYTNVAPAAISFQINYDPDLTSTESTWWGRLVYEPYMNATVTNGTWQTWDMIDGGNGKWWASPNANSTVDNACPQAAPCTLTSLIAAYPNIGIRSDGLSFILFKAGSGSNGMDGNVDNFTFTTAGNTDTYDFEPPATVYVDDDWVGTTPGTDPDGAGPAVSFGANGDAFATVQNGINAVDAGGTVRVYAGTYAEDLQIDKSISLLGPNDTINPNTGSRVAEAVLHPATSNPNPSVCTVMAYLTANNITIKGLSFDGDNPALTSGIMIGSADVDACEIIASYAGIGNVTVENNILDHSTYSAVDFYNSSGAVTSNNYIRYNLIRNIGETTYNWGLGVLVYNNFYADITDNVLNNVRVGVQTGNFEKANTGSTGSISNNTINAWRTGIFHNLWYSNASTITISGNTINAISSSGSVKWNGMLLSSFQGAVNATISNNTINIGVITQNPAVGYNIWNTPTTAPLTISGGSVNGGKYGVWVNNFEGYASNASNTSIILDGVTIDGASTAGIYVLDSASNTNSATVHADIQNSTISNSTTGILLEGSDATADANFNQITGNSTAGLSNTSGNAMDAEKNWWNSLTGPSGSGPGSGDSVSADVDFTPWCGDAACTVFYPPFPLTVKANNQSITVGQSDPIFTFTYTGLVNGDTSASIDVAPTCSVSGAHAAPGVYTISCSGGSDANYTFSYSTGTLTVNAANNPPTDISISDATIDENQTSGTVVGTFSTTDPDAGDTFTYSFCGGTNDASFQFNGADLQSAVSFDFETKNSYSICVRSTDSNTLNTTKTFTINIHNLIDTATFADVPMSHPYWMDIEILYANGLTAGCSVTPLNYCPDQFMDRAQAAVFTLRGSYGTGYTPPAAPWDRFADDWTSGAWAEKWAEGMWNAGLTAGCATSPLRYCPWDQTPRVQAAVFGLRLKYGNTYVPPAASGTVFFDMTNASYYGTKWAEQAYADGLLPNCGTDIGSGKPLFCPDDLVSRGLAAYMIVRAKNLTAP